MVSCFGVLLSLLERYSPYFQADTKSHFFVIASERVLTLPIALQPDAGGSIVPHIFAVFFLTYAFLGLEVLSIELENPFGKDLVDIDNLGVAKLIFEDIYSMVDIIDGPEWSMKLRVKMSEGNDTYSTPPSESSPLMIT